MTLTEFLLARIAEAEEAASRAQHIEQFYIAEGFEVSYEWARLIAHPNGGRGTAFEPGCPSPDRVLAACRAKRRIVSRCVVTGNTESTSWRWAVLKDLAAEYHEHPDFLPIWQAD